MSEHMKTWDLRELTVNFATMPIEEGAGEGGSFVTIERPTDTYTFQEGADGSIVSCATGSKLVRVTISLLQTAAGNATLSAIHQIDKKTKNGGGVAPLMIRDRQGLSILFCSRARITKFPDSEYATGVTNRQWVIVGEETEAFEGGN